MKGTTIAEFIVTLILNTEDDIDQCRDKVIESYEGKLIDADDKASVTSIGMLEWEDSLWTREKLIEAFECVMRDIPELN